MATWLGVDVRVYDDCVVDESRQRMRRQKMRWEDSHERGHVARSAVDLETVHSSELSRVVSQSVNLDAGVKFHVEQDCHCLGENLVEFEFAAFSGGTDVTSEAQPSGVRSKASLKDPFIN